MVDHVGKVVLPGDVLENLTASEKTSKVILGPGLQQDSSEIYVTKPGVLKFKAPNVFWIDSLSKRYVPAKDDSVVGIVTAKAGDIFRLDVGSNEQASLSYLAFDGATKRNRPDVRVGDLVFCKFLVANKDMEGEVVCINSSGKSGGLGVIGRDGGYMFQSSLNLAQKILHPECELLKLLGKYFQYESCIGMNGRIWVKAQTIIQTVLISNAISTAEFMTNKQIHAMCSNLSNATVGL